MSRWLPYHQDRLFVMFQAAAQGGYRPSFTPDPEEEPDPASVRAAANRALDDFSRRADVAISRARQKRGR